ncbi:MAG: hypothetical protein D6743_04020 [Calditrichaeota bacterium]|nr:MAG: hypothetical protein D6743_04020 [Calditrichota bacterium]
MQIPRPIVLLLIPALTAFGCDFLTVFGNESTAGKSAPPAEEILSVEITGGFAGVYQTFLVDEAGRAVFTDMGTAAAWEMTLTPAGLDALRRLFLENGFFQLRGDYFSGVVDANFYSITFSHNSRTNHVRTDYFGAPPNLKWIVDGINALIAKIENARPALELRLSRQEIEAGESVDLTLLVENRSTETQRLHFATGQIFDFLVQRDGPPGDFDDPQLLWNWAHDRVFTQNTWFLDLAPGESRSYTVTWDGRDNAGEQVTGEVLVAAKLVSSPGGSPARVRLNILAGQAPPERKQAEEVRL